MTSLQYAKNAYANTTVNTSSSLDLVVLLYDGAIGHLGMAAYYMEKGNISQKVYYLSKAMAMVEELLISINTEIGGDAGREIAENLQDLYVYMLRELAVANATDDAAKVKNVEGLLKELKSAWDAVR
ncbi:MAG: flagellar export chaperone FliS [Deltaproteobacteria bacterium]|nr:flagellar export chaperone FliS [Deltaproteobacteria bacterium]